MAKCLDCPATQEGRGMSEQEVTWSGFRPDRIEAIVQMHGLDEGEDE